MTELEGLCKYIYKKNWIASSSSEMKKKMIKWENFGVKQVNNQGMFLLNMIDRYHV